MRVRYTISQLEVGLEEDRIPLAQPLAERADALGRARERAVQPLLGAPSSAADAVLLTQADDELECLLVLRHGPRRLNVLVE